MVCDDNNFIGTPNGFLKPPADDVIDFFITESDVENEMGEDSIYIITDDDEEVDDLYDDASYVTDTYDEDDYYFSDEEIEEENEVDNVVYRSEVDSDSEDQDIMGESTFRIAIQNSVSGASNSNTNTTEKLNQAATQTDQNGTDNKG